VTLLLLFAGLTLAAPARATPEEALRYYNSGNYTNAMKEYERLADTDTNDFRLVFNAGAAAYRGTNYDEAEKDFKWVTLSPNLKLQQAAFYNLGNTHFRVGEQAKDLDEMQKIWEAAQKDYERAVNLNPRDTNAVANLDFVKAQIQFIIRFRAAIQQAQANANEATRRREYHRALEYMEPLEKTVVAKKYEDYIKKLKDIDAIVTPPQR